jgi:hypothetical protein
VLSFYFLVNPIASSHFQNAQQQNITQNYSLNSNPMQMNHYDASFNPTNNNFNNFDPSINNQFQYNSQQQSQSYQNQPTTSAAQNPQYPQAGHIQQQQQIYQPSTQQQNMQQYYNQSLVNTQQQQHSVNNGPTSTYQHTINDLLMQQPTTNFNQQQQPQNLYNSQEHIANQHLQSNQSVSCLIKLIES